MTAQHDDQDLQALLDQMEQAAKDAHAKPSPEFIQVMSEHVGDDPDRLQDLWTQYSTHMQLRVDYLTELAVEKSIITLKSQYLEIGEEFDQDTEDFARVVSWNSAQSMLSNLWDSEIVDMKAYIQMEIPEDYVSPED